MRHTNRAKRGRVPTQLRTADSVRRIVIRAPSAAAFGAGVLLLVVVLIGPARAAGTTPPAVSRLSVPLALAVFDPCAGELVEFGGALNFEALGTVLEDGQIALEFKVQATDVAGSGLSTGAPYRLVGQAHGVSTDPNRDRAVTAADFALLATSEPGAAIGRAHVKPAATISFRTTISEDGLVERLGVESVFVDQECA
jgi:hypothetical protein